MSKSLVNDGEPIRIMLPMSLTWAAPLELLGKVIRRGNWLGIVTGTDTYKQNAPMIPLIVQPVIEVDGHRDGDWWDRLEIIDLPDS
jgi:hypothetical protein